MEATHVGAWMAGRNDSDVQEALDMLAVAPSFRDPGCTATSNGKLFGEGKYPLTVTVEGEVENSIVSRSVRIEKGASVKNCILMEGCVIEAGAHLENVICDKGVTVTAGTIIRGTDDSPCVLPKGGVI